jgi:two-component system, NarL family, sensor kinase
LNLKFFVVLFFCFSTLFSQQGEKSDLDSISYYLINSSKKKSNDFESKLSYALRAKEISEKYKIDSLILKSEINLSLIYLDKDEAFPFLKKSHNALKLAEKIKDSSSLAFVNKKLGYYYFDKSVDSAYYYDIRAEKLYRNLKDKFNIAVVLLDIASLQFSDKDYTGSELTAVKGLSLLNQLEETDEIAKYKSFFYNNLGLVFRLLEQYDESILYYNKALDIQSKLYSKDSNIISGQKNNLANTYRSAGQYEVALGYYKEILSKENLISDDPGFYVQLLDNYAYTLYLSKQYEQFPKLYLDALKICDSIGSDYYSIVINQHLAEYYHDNDNQDSAKYYAYKAKEVSESYYNDDLLQSLLLLSRIEDDSMAVKHYDAYIKLNDSLQKNERAHRNKFARIQFETDEIEQKNIQITREKLWLMLLSGILLITALLIYVIVTQRNKNKELQLVQQQQEANEEIYNLMLSQQDKVEEARSNEKKRVSQELHDGVLGRLFGTRLSLDSLNLSSTAEAIKTRGQYIDELKTIEQDIRKVSHELNTDFVSGSGFVEIIKTLVGTQSEVYKIKYLLNFDDSITWDDVSNKTKIYIYRIIQETLHNIYKHAHANLVKISLQLKNNVIWLTISDDGVGFDVEKAKKGIGIKNMNARVNEIDGILHIKSEKDKGTTIIIIIPT